MSRRRSEVFEGVPVWTMTAPQGRRNIKRSKGIFYEVVHQLYILFWLEEAAKNHLPGLWPAHNCQSIEATPPRRPQGTSVYLSSCLSMEEAKIPEGAWLQTDLQILGEEKNILSFNLVSLLAWFKAHTSARGKDALLFTVQSKLPEPPHWGPQCHSFPHQEHSGTRTLSGRTNLGRASVCSASRSWPPLHTSSRLKPPPSPPHFPFLLMTPHDS